MSDAGGNDAVTVAFLHRNDVAFSWHKSLMDLIGYDLTQGSQRVIRGGWLGMRAATGGIVEGRNKAVREFLDTRDADWLWWVDSDMGFAPDTVDRLVQAADPVSRPIVGGLCFAYRETNPDGMSGHRCAPRPTIFDWVHDGDQSGFKGRTAYPINAVVPAAGTGSACVLIHRSVFERIEGEFGAVWYDRVPNQSTGQLIGEDLSFCVRAGAVGVPVHVHTGVRTTHQKTTWVGEEDYWRHAIAPPATERVAVLVPVLGRPQNAGPFMASLRASTGLASVYALVGPEDSEEAHQASVSAWERAGANVIRTPGVSFAEKVNVGARAVTEPWLFLTGDDVRFHAGWLDHAQAAAGERAHVVGTNDLGNPKVVRGEHSAHLLVRRSYVVEHGGSWDGPGVLAHEGYRHWFVDNEIIEAARQRGVWAMALGSLVEHLHPLWDKAERDATYELGMSFADDDEQVFRTRLEKFG